MDTGVGFKSPLFFVGVVENNEDPRMEGRVQVRAFGVHGTNKQIPTEDLPWATLIIGSHDTNFVVPPLNAWVLGFFLDGRDAQQPMVIGLIPTQMLEPIDPEANGWGVALGDGLDVGAMGHRHRDFGEPMVSRYARGESTEGTIYPALEANRRVNVDVAGSPTINSVGNRNQYSGDEDLSPGNVPTADIASLEDFIIGFEGFSPTAYSDFAQTSIGYGTRARPGETTITQAEARLRLREEVTSTRQSVISYGQRYGYNWNTNQINALTSFSYNLGLGRPASGNRTATGLYQLTGGDQGTGGGRTDSEIARMMLEYNKAGGVVQQGLVNRRRDEANLFQTPVDGEQQPDQEEPQVDGDEEQQTQEQPTPTDDGADEPESTTWSEPVSGYMPQYPFNRVLETPGGHVIEIDSTQRAERIMVWHPSGTYIQMTPTTNTYKSTRDHYDVLERNHHIYVGGKNYLTIEGDCHVLVKGNKTEEIRGDYRQIVHGNIEIGGGGQIAINGAEETQIRSARLDLESNVENLNLRVGKKIVLSSGEGLHLKGDGVFIESKSDINIKAGDNLTLSSAADSTLTGASVFVDADGEANIIGVPVRIGGSEVHINAPTVNIDDFVNLSGGQAEAAAEAPRTAEEAEEATEVEMQTPPDRDVNLAGALADAPPPEETEQAPTAPETPQPAGPQQEDTANNLEQYQLIGAASEQGLALIRQPNGEVASLREGDMLSQYTVQAIDYATNAVTLVDSSGVTQSLEQITDSAERIRSLRSAIEDNLSRNPSSDQ